MGDEEEGGEGNVKVMEVVLEDVGEEMVVAGVVGRRRGAGGTPCQGLA